MKIKFIASILAVMALISFAFASCSKKEVERRDFTTVENLRDEEGYWKEWPENAEELMNETARFLFICGHDLSQDTQLSLAGIYLNRTLSTDWDTVDVLWHDEEAERIAAEIDFYAYWHEGAKLPKEAIFYRYEIDVACSNADVAVFEGQEPYQFSTHEPVFFVSWDKPANEEKWTRIGELWFAANP